MNTACGRPAVRHETRRAKPPANPTALKLRTTLVRCSMRGMAVQMTGAEANQKPGGLVLLAFQVGDRPRVVSHAFGHEVNLTFFRRQPRSVAN